jgi:hypothetical protein
MRYERAGWTGGTSAFVPPTRLSALGTLPEYFYTVLLSVVAAYRYDAFGKVNRQHQPAGFHAFGFAGDLFVTAVSIFEAHAWSRCCLRK